MRCIIMHFETLANMKEAIRFTCILEFRECSNIHRVGYNSMFKIIEHIQSSWTKNWKLLAKVNETNLKLNYTVMNMSQVSWLIELFLLKITLKSFSQVIVLVEHWRVNLICVISVHFSCENFHNFYAEKNAKTTRTGKFIDKIWNSQNIL